MLTPHESSWFARWLGRSQRILMWTLVCMVLEAVGFSRRSRHKNIYTTLVYINIGTRRTVPRHTRGPFKPVVKLLYARGKKTYALLGCGHAVAHWCFNYKPRWKSCPFCCKEMLEFHLYLDGIKDVEAALLEGKRQQLLRYYRLKDQEPPEKIRRPKSPIALYEKRRDVIEEELTVQMRLKQV